MIVLTNPCCCGGCPVSPIPDSPPFDITSAGLATFTVDGLVYTRAGFFGTPPTIAQYTEPGGGSALLNDQGINFTPAGGGFPTSKLKFTRAIGGRSVWLAEDGTLNGVAPKEQWISGTGPPVYSITGQVVIGDASKYPAYTVFLSSDGYGGSCCIKILYVHSRIGMIGGNAIYGESDTFRPQLPETCWSRATCHTGPVGVAGELNYHGKSTSATGSVDYTYNTASDHESGNPGNMDAYFLATPCDQYLGLTPKVLKNNIPLVQNLNRFNRVKINGACYTLSVFCTPGDPPTYDLLAYGLNIEQSMFNPATGTTSTTWNNAGHSGYGCGIEECPIHIYLLTPCLGGGDGTVVQSTSTISSGTIFTMLPGDASSKQYIVSASTATPTVSLGAFSAGPDGCAASLYFITPCGSTTPVLEAYFSDSGLDGMEIRFTTAPPGTDTTTVYRLTFSGTGDPGSDHVITPAEYVGDSCPPPAGNCTAGVGYEDIPFFVDFTPVLGKWYVVSSEEEFGCRAFQASTPMFPCDEGSPVLSLVAGPFDSPARVFRLYSCSTSSDLPDTYWTNDPAISDMYAVNAITIGGDLYLMYEASNCPLVEFTTPYTDPTISVGCP